MRPTVFLLAACLCAILLYDRFCGPFPATAAPGAAAQTGLHQETRLEKLRHYQVLLQLLAVERGDLKFLEESRNSTRSFLIDKTFEEQLDKELRPTWYRMENSSADTIWQDSLTSDKRQAILQDEQNKRDLIRRKRDAYSHALQNPQGDAAKAFEKKVEDYTEVKQFRAQQEFVKMLERERDVVHEALKQK